MNYRNLDKNIFLKLNHNQAYVAACFSFKSDFVTGESHIHQDTLADYCQCSPSKIQDYISVFKKVVALGTNGKTLSETQVAIKVPHR